MLTGVECAGLVLAAFPLVIEGFKLYYDGLQEIKNVREYRSNLDQFARDLGLEKTLFEDTINRIQKLYDYHHALTQPGPTINVVDLLQARTGNSESHQEPDLHALLSRALRFSNKDMVKKFGDAVMDMANIIEKVKQDFEIEKAFVGDKSQLKKLVKMLKTELNAEYRNRQLSLLRHHNVALNRIVSGEYQGQTLAMLRSHSQDRRRLPEDATAQITFYNQIQREAKAIFSVLQEAILPSACCEIPHEASLQLDMRQSHMHRDVHSRFKLCFSFEHAMVCDLELEVMVVKERIASRLESYTYYSRYVPKIAVTRCEGTTADARPLYSPALDRSSSICRICAESNNAVITCLCTGIKRAKGQKVCIGVLASEANGTFRICPQHPGLHLRPKDIISLGGLLAQWKPGPFMKDRLKLTLQLATAVLQLYDTCWLDYLWSSKDILFERDKSGHPVLSRPYVQKTFNGYSPALTPNTKDDLSAKKIARMCKKMLRSLGIVLLEIYHWKCIADLQSQLPKEGDETDEDPVSNLAADIVNIAGKTYGSVVEGCVYGWGRAKALADEEFKVEVYQKIVAPLEEHLKYFCGVKDLQKVFS